ncbi:putative cystathionine/methionine gamma-synthase/lyase [Actinoplanes missouriensis 431]|uniref:Putative cystathionine/methionine gamma-synthase/lyase n=1 Tax=Actinoplanes missouriensis (strain ATCC 14538 / DSM 43046 / CBS 188.64 / JCM 3121 / NBRC 102363 / NCIMB 12654 / NRRL B-3342 / UNCC 431) TaxID=512565 RepID=I0HH19_ACTM4|nr:cystathionine gamma-lyase [Actinoplanes missouriensis]BAL92306.1 putative cystathionine/methionine gamma-synthase/lyase [Actinoplanes missouriensis 431]
MSTPFSDGTRSVHAGLPAPAVGEPFLPGPVFAAPYHLDPATGPGEHGYARTEHPTRELLEAAIGELEGGPALAFSSGQAAITALLLAVLRSGDTVALPADGYFTVRAFAESFLRDLGVTTVLVPTAGPYPDLTGVRLVLLETPANPGLDVCDVRAVAAQAHRAGALVAVDNTTATPLGQNPLALGADLVVASGTKALTGHSDVLLGYVAATDPELLGRVETWRKQTGAVPGAFDCWLAHRSIATLDLRLARQSRNAEALASLLVSRTDVTGVRWPGLPADPSFAVASAQMRRIPGVVSFDLGTAERVARFLDAARLVFAATSFGGVHTTADRRAQWGDDTSPGFVRFSCGIEDTADLIADVTAALDASR